MHDRWFVEMPRSAWFSDEQLTLWFVLSKPINVADWTSSISKIAKIHSISSFRGEFTHPLNASSLARLRQSVAAGESVEYVCERDGQLLYLRHLWLLSSPLAVHVCELELSVGNLCRYCANNIDQARYWLVQVVDQINTTLEANRILASIGGFGLAPINELNLETWQELL